MYLLLELNRGEARGEGKGVKSDTRVSSEEQRESSKIDLDRPGMVCLDTIF